MTHAASAKAFLKAMFALYAGMRTGSATGEGTHRGQVADVLWMPRVASRLACDVEANSDGNLGRLRRSQKWQ
jgi:hypothetical protein